MLLTKESILKAAFSCFYQNGFDKTSLTAIADEAGVTRGAIYWHFEDKKDLFRAVADYTLNKGGDIVGYCKGLPNDMLFPERMAEMFWYALDDNIYVDYVFRMINYTIVTQEFPDVLERIEQEKKRLYSFILEEATRYSEENGYHSEKVEIAASSLALTFEGMFLNTYVKNGITLDRDHVFQCTELIAHSLDSKD